MIPLNFEELMAFYQFHDRWLDDIGVRRLEPTDKSINDRWFVHCESNGISWESNSGWSFHNEKARVAFIMKWV